MRLVAGHLRDHQMESKECKGDVIPIFRTAEGAENGTIFPYFITYLAEGGIAGRYKLVIVG